jgi:hypothetical protein
MKSFLDTLPDAHPSGGTASPAREINTSVPIPLPQKFYRGVTSSIRLLPDFLIIGTQRGGTTSLFHYLEAHACIKSAVNKDLHFFDRKYDKGLGWYRGHFPTRVEQWFTRRLQGRAFLTVEASPSYLFHPHAAGRVARAVPRVRLIVLLRNPVSRAYSQYHHAVELGHESLSFEEAIQGEEERTAGEWERMLREEHYYSEAFKHRSYLSKGIYVEQLRTWMALFPREQFLILKSEEFYADPAGSVAQVLAFLGLSPDELRLEQRAFKQYNNNIYPSGLSASTRERLAAYFEPHNRRLYDLLGADFGWDE